MIVLLRQTIKIPSTHKKQKPPKRPLLFVFYGGMKAINWDLRQGAAANVGGGHPYPTPFHDGKRAINWDL